jgi:peptidoglycan-associated lipoprotein
LTARYFPLLTVYYGYEEFAVPANGVASLDRIAGFLRANPGIRVVVEGHFAEFDAEGRPPAPEYALALGQRRAAGIQQFLESRGVAAGRIRTTSRGNQNPRIPARNPEEQVNELLRAINSRAEVYAWLTG